MKPRDLLIELEHCQREIHRMASPDYVRGYQQAVTDLRVLVQADDVNRQTEAAS